MPFIQQSTKIGWLKYGYTNTKLFHNNIKHRSGHNKINMIQVQGKIISDQEGISKTFHDYYFEVLRSNMLDRQRINMQIIHAGPVLDFDSWSLLDLNFSPTEIKEAIWSINNKKAPRLDGFNSKFYKAFWARPQLSLSFPKSPVLLVQGTTCLFVLSYFLQVYIQTNLLSIEKSSWEINQSYTRCFRHGKIHQPQHFIMPRYCEALLKERLLS